MSVPQNMEGPGPGVQPRLSVDAGRLWMGGVATAVVAALVAIVGVLVARGLFDVAVLAPKGKGPWGDASTAMLAGLAAAAALLATGLRQTHPLSGEPDQVQPGRDQEPGEFRVGGAGRSWRPPVRLHAAPSCVAPSPAHQGPPTPAVPPGWAEG